MSEDEETALICMRCDELGEPRAPSFVDKCCVCDTDVWRAYSSPEVDHVLCAPCAHKKIDEEREKGKPPVFEGPTVEQMREARDYWRKHRQ